MDAIDYLLSEHQHHRELLDLIEEDRSHYPEFRRELVHHVNMEEAVLYPRLLKVPALESVVREAWEEHSVCMGLVQELDKEGLSDIEWISKFAVLKKILLIHLDEEETRLFPKIKKLATPEFLHDVGEQMRIQKKLTTTDEILYPEK